MQQSDIAALMKGAAPAIRDLAVSMMQPLVEKIEELEREVMELRSADSGVDRVEIEAVVAECVKAAVGDIPTPAPGKDADPEVTAELVRQEVSKAVSEFPIPKDGASVTVDDVAPLIESAVAKAVGDIPVPKDGIGFAGAIIDRNGDLIMTLSNGEAKSLGPVVGKSVDMDEIKSMIAPVIAKSVADAVSEIPPAKDGESVDPAEVERAVAKAVEALPKPKDGEPGKDADPEAIANTVREMLATDVEDIKSAIDEAKSIKAPELPDIDAMVAMAVESLPKPKDGTSVTIEDVTPLIVEEVAKVVAEIPVPKDGSSVTLDDVAPFISEAVEKAVDALPKPKDGKDGKLPIAKAWVDDIHYAGDVVTHSGSLYQALKDTGREPPSDDWVCLAARGEDGKSADEIEVKGTYKQDGEYTRLNVVALNGATFIAKRDNPGACPGDGWQLMSAQGKRGGPGEPGKKGEPGNRGLPGPEVVSVSVDDMGMLTLVNANGNDVQCDLYDVLVKR